MRTYRPYLLLTLLLCLTRQILAQSTVGLPLQPEKLAYAKEIEREAVTKNDTLLMAEAYYLYGKVYVAAQNYLKAKDYYVKSLRIVEKQRDFGKVARLYLRMSEMENYQNNATKSLEFAHIALNLWKRHGSKKNVTAALQQIGALYVATWQNNLTTRYKQPFLDSLLYYCRTSEQMAYELKDTLAITNISVIFGDFYRLQGSHKAFQYYRTALNLYKATGSKHRQAYLIQKLALSYLRFNQPNEAYLLLQESERMYKALNIRELNTEKAFAEAYLQYYQQKKEWEKVLEQSQIVRHYERDQMIADRDGAVSRLSIEYDTEKKEAQLKNQQRELMLSQENQQTQRQFLMVLSVLLLGTGLASIAFYQLSRRNRRLSLHNAALVREQNHRVKNNLQLVSSLLSLQSNRLDDESARSAVEDSQRRIEVMSLLQRKLYDGDNLVTVNVSEFMQELVAMVLKAFEQEQVDVAYQITPTMMLPADCVMRIGLIANELVTNACKYAFPDNPKPSLQITASLAHKRFHLRVIDNGPGFTETKAPVRSFGLRLIQMQVEQLFGTYRFESNGNLQFDMTFTLLPSFSPAGETKINLA